MIKKLNEKLHTPLWLFWLLFVVLILRIPSFFEPYSYGDEMIYLTLGEAVRRGLTLYRDIHDNKPPLLYLLAALAGSLFWFKAILTVWHLITVFLFWKLTDTLYPTGSKTPSTRRGRNLRLQKVATVVFALLTTLPLLEGNIANSEIFMLAPTIAALLILLAKKNNFKNIFSAGVLFSAAALFKIPAAFDVPAIVFYWLITTKLNKKGVLEVSRKTFILTFGFASPILITFIWYTLKGAFHEYLVAAFLQNFGYLSSWRPESASGSFITRNAPLLIRAGFVALGLLILYVKRKKLSKNFSFVSGWLLLTLFAVTLSERPYPHYLIQATPPGSILIAMFFAKKDIEQVLAIIPLAVASFVPVYYHFWYYPILPYYSKFTKFATGQISKNDYLLTFGGRTVTNYKIADYLVRSSNPSDKVFVWGGDSATVYALSRRLPPGKYVATYHIKDFSSPGLVMETLKNDMPVFVVVLPDSEPFPQLQNFLTTNYGLSETIDNTQIWRLLGPKVRSLLNSTY